MGSIYDTVCETSDYLNANGRKTGVIHVHLYRPFSVERLLDAIPDSVEKIAVLDRTKEPGAFGEPLFLDVAAALAEVGSDITIVGGRYGLGSKDTKPVHIAAVYDLLTEDDPQPRFTIGIHDDVTNLSLPVGDDIQVSPPGTISAVFGVSVPTAPSAQTKTRSKSLATTRRCTLRLISHTTRRSRAA